MGNFYSWLKLQESTHELEYLKSLEDEYPHQPPFAQKADLAEINRLREKLGMPPFEPNAPKKPEIKPKINVSKPKAKPSWTPQAEEIYKAYLRKLEELKPHQEYALRIEDVTKGGGQTLVEPLATYGTNGGPLLCDYCHKPIPLEGGEYNNVTADIAWRKKPVKGWKSYILGGMVVEAVPNDTIRIYHGYPHNQNACCNKAKREMEKEESEFKSPLTPEMKKDLLSFLEDKFPDNYLKIFNNINNILFSYDPGIGINRPN